jgi:hypothetical protein
MTAKKKKRRLQAASALVKVGALSVKEEEACSDVDDFVNVSKTALNKCEKRGLQLS